MTQVNEWGRTIYEVDRFVRCRGQNNRRRNSHTKQVTFSPCKKMLAEFVARPWRIVCPRCGEVNEAFPTGKSGDIAASS